MGSVAERSRAVPDGWLKPGVLLGALAPLAVLVVGALRGTLGANPISEVINQLGLLALILLIASLAATPLKLLLGWTWPLRIRRLLGLLAFFYATLHMLSYVVVDRWGELATLAEDIAKRPFITVGLLAWALLVPLALTSTRASIKRMGFKSWQRLHRLAYLAAVLAIVHFVWRVKKDASEPFTYAAILATLLAVRWFAGRGAKRTRT
jgi:methionine sulfoxide reductase heme-binding subunit